MEKLIVRQKQTIEIKTPAGLKIICVKNILYVEAAGKCSIVYLIDFSTIISYQSLKWFNRYLFQPYFFRCHNSFIVNCQLIDCYWNNRIIFRDRNRIPISRNKILPFKENLKYLQEEKV